ncbi:preprotein translocase subunit YajC [Marinicauda algicola]|uniref:Sec translocon accessory complex subunit YajC n=1 Tax=Marinicauda algicola TaxID=2029849 RepID=A0A4S2GZQ8_9PROT|nr:preprotein translocase subunit YajC [Marinicauda algicola]TGY88573.1 preprotein translocase subunit YajC [Marinicauda algicola]
MFFTDHLILAAAAGGGGASAFLIQIAPLILIFVVFYFLLIRPQQQRMKKHREMIENLRRGDEVVTAGGMIGKVTRIAENEVTVELAENVRVKVVKHTISEVRSRTEPSKGSKSKAAEEDEEDKA